MPRVKSPTLGHWVQYLAFRGFEFGLNLISLETVFKFGELTGRIVHRLAKKPRLQVTRNLRLAFGDELSKDERDHLVAEIFERAGANFFSSLKVPFLTNEKIMNHLGFRGLEKLHSIADQKGIVLVSPHMGNWELLAQAVFLTESDLKVGSHYRPLNNSLINAVIERRRKKRGLKLFAKRSSTHLITSFIREGGAAAVLADQRVGSRGAPCVFFGRPTTCSALPHLLAKRSKGQLISIVCETVGIAKWRVSFDLIHEASAQACASQLEAAWRKSPADVFWFEDRWRLKGADALDFLNKYKDPTAVSRPLRIIHLGDSAQGLPYPSEFIAEETSALNFDQNDDAIRGALEKLATSGHSPVDVFVTPPEQTKRIKKLVGKILVLSSKDR